MKDRSRESSVEREGELQAVGRPGGQVECGGCSCRMRRLVCPTGECGMEPVGHGLLKDLRKGVLCLLSRWRPELGMGWVGQ